MKIGNYEIGPHKPVYIIAEAGVNHNGDIEMALELVRQAKLAGADCVKFQTFKAEAIVTQSAPKAKYQTLVTDPAESQLAMLKKLELDFDAYRAITSLCKELGIQFLSTPYNFNDVDFLLSVGVDAFKVASGQLVELPFLKYLAGMKKPILLSTGMSTLGEVEAAVDAIKEQGLEDLVLLQCTTNYPSSHQDANIRAMLSMQRAFDCLVGYSDHTVTDHAVFASIALGASVIEKHFTLDKELPGPDHSSSLNPREFKAMVEGVRLTERVLGSFVKRPSAAEKANIQGMRRSLVAIVEIPAGEIIQREHIAFKRPATGLSPNLLDQVVGRKAKLTICADTPITMNAIDW